LKINKVFNRPVSVIDNCSFISIFDIFVSITKKMFF